MKSLIRIKYIVLGLLISIVLLLTSIEIVSFNTRHYIREYKKHRITDITGISMEGLENITKELLSYLKDDRNNLVITDIVKGEQREIFGQREKEHMIDVKELFIKGRYIRNVSFIIMVLILIFMIKNKEKQGLAKIFLYTFIINIILIIIMMLLIYFNFDRYFDCFHHIFFNNDLWQLNPNTDIMIQMLPQEFFYNTATKVILVYITNIVILGTIGVLNNKKTV